MKTSVPIGTFDTNLVHLAFGFTAQLLAPVITNVTVGAFLFSTNLRPKPEEIVLIPTVGAWHLNNDRPFSHRALHFIHSHVYNISIILPRRYRKMQSKVQILRVFTSMSQCAELCTGSKRCTRRIKFGPPANLSFSNREYAQRASQRSALYK